MSAYRDRTTDLPFNGKLLLFHTCSSLIAVFTMAVSIASLRYRAIIYPTDDLVRTFVPNDVVNLGIGLPILLGSMWLAWRGKLVGLLCWTGALFFVLYNNTAYVFAMPLNWAFLLHLLLILLSVYTLIGLVANIDGKVIQQRLAGTVPEKLAGGALAGLGLLFFMRATGILVSAVSGEASPAKTELAVNVTDFLTTPAWIIVGILLWRRKAFGYVAGLGLLFQGSMLFIALILFLLLQPFLTTAPLAGGDVVVVFVMGLICFIPFGLLVRGVVAMPRTRSE